MPELNNNQDETAGADKAAGEYQTQSDDALSKLKAARKEVSAICKGKSWQMRVPVDQSDSDIVICDGIDAAKNEIASALRELTPNPAIGLLDAVRQYVANHEAAEAEIARLREIVKQARELAHEAEDVASYAEDGLDEAGDTLVPNYKLRVLGVSIEWMKAAEAATRKDGEQ